ncbi:hypothetical protein [Sphaerimonospora mesophila]|uniref:hypothetical protein n=1 Tax=Sphaerimonospora mesophila TaxID=37483 RepID=UPI0006E23DBC
MNEHNSSPRTESSEHQPSTKGISKDEVRSILTDCECAGLPKEIDDDTLLVIDSFAAIWIQHLLEERHGVVVRLSGETADVDSVDSLHVLINRNLGVGTP